MGYYFEMNCLCFQKMQYEWLILKVYQKNIYFLVDYLDVNKEINICDVCVCKVYYFYKVKNGDYLNFIF